MAIIRHHNSNCKQYTNSETTQMLPEIKKTLEVFQQGNEIVEIRILKAGVNGKSILSSYFDLNVNTLDKVMKEIDRKKLFKHSIYMTLNRVCPDVCQGKAGNSIRAAWSVTKDKDISAFRFIHVDLDPERETNTQATAEEMKHAEDLMYQIKDYLSEQGFSEPILSFSGNGYNLDYKVDLPNTKENSQLIRAVLPALSAKFSNQYVKIDTTTYNAARIIKLYGCWSCKGENTPERPYRQSKILSVPDIVSITNKGFIEKFLTVEAQSSAPKLKQQSASQSKLIKDDSGRKIAHIRDVPKWLQSYNLGYNIKDNDEYTIYTLDVCPFNTEHINGSSFVQVFDNGNVFFKCHHDHCAGYTIHDMLKIYPDKTRQIPLMEETDMISKLFNEVGDQVELVLTPMGEQYIRYNNEVIPFSSDKVGSYIRKIAQKIGQLPSDSTVKRILGNLGSHFDGIPFTARKLVGNRVLMHKNLLLYAGSRSNIYIIGNGEVKRYNGNGVYFIKGDGVSGQIEPDLSVNPAELPDLIRSSLNISEDSLLRFLAQLLCFYIPNINTPILVLSGAQGTSKTTTARKVKSLVDPCIIDVVATPDREDGLTSMLANNYLTVFDNAERLSTRFSDLLAIACTGGYTSRRKLYTDSDVSAVNLRSKVVITGIGDLITRPDLAERCNIIYLNPLPVRRTEAEIRSEFRLVKPKLLGAIFNALSIGLPLIGDMTRKYEGKLPRMADFCVYGAAFIKAIGLNDEDFVEDYTRSTNNGVGECRETDPFNLLIKGYLSSVEGFKWVGRAKELLEALRHYAKDNRMHFDEHLSSSSLSRRLGQNQDALRSMGIVFNRDKTGAERVIELSLESEEETDHTVTPTLTSKGKRIVPKKEIPKVNLDEEIEGW